MRKLLIGFTMIMALLAPLTALAATGGVTDAETSQQLAAARQATANYHTVDAALADGYISTEEGVELPGVGGMGVHYLNPAYFGQAFVTRQVTLEQSPALLYEERGGKLHLVGVEYFYPIVLASGATWWGHDVPAGDLAPAPTLFGQRFDGPMAGHSPEMPAHYDLHVWLWKGSPSGIFSTWNPNVSCPAHH